MPKQILVEAFRYEELSDKAKEKVKEWFNKDVNLWDKYAQEQWEKDLEELGYSDIDIRWSGFYSQGDGASIACSVDVRKFLTRNDLLIRFSPMIGWINQCGEELHISIYRDQWGHYVHENLLDFPTDDLLNSLENAGILLNKMVLSVVNEIGELILEEVKEKSRELYKFLQDDYDYHFTDEYMVEACESNEYFFNEYGDPIHHLDLENVVS